MTAIERVAYVRDLAAERPVVWPLPEHGEGECESCDEMRWLAALDPDEDACGACQCKLLDADEIHPYESDEWACSQACWDRLARMDFDGGAGDW